MKKMFLFVPFFILFSPLTVFAAEMAEEASSPKWFYLFEIFGSIIAIASLVALLKSAFLLGGAFGKTFRLFAISIAMISFSLIWRVYMEISGEESFLNELIFEIPIYIALLIILVASLLIRKVLLGKID